jgi:hypothetical protein
MSELLKKFPKKFALSGLKSKVIKIFRNFLIKTEI